MSDPSYFRAKAAEFGAVPAYFIAGPQSPAIGVLVRSFHDEQFGMRLAIEQKLKGIEAQLVIQPVDFAQLLEDRQSSDG